MTANWHAHSGDARAGYRLDEREEEAREGKQPLDSRRYSKDEATSEERAPPSTNTWMMSTLMEAGRATCACADTT